MKICSNLELEKTTGRGVGQRHGRGALDGGGRHEEAGRVGARDGEEREDGGHGAKLVEVRDLSCDGYGRTRSRASNPTPFPAFVQLNKMIQGIFQRWLQCFVYSYLF